MGFLFLKIKIKRTKGKPEGSPFILRAPRRTTEHRSARRPKAWRRCYRVFFFFNCFFIGFFIGFFICFFIGFFIGFDDK